MEDRFQQELNDALNSAEYHRRAFKESFRVFFRTGIFTLVCFVSLVVFSIAWFSNNTKIRANGMQISVDTKQYELRSYGNNGVHDDVLMHIMGTSGEKGFWYIDNSRFVETDGSKPTVNWLLNDQSHMENYSDDDVDWSNEQNSRFDYAIEPGANGNIQFYIVPKYSGNIKVQCTLDLIPYHYVDSRLELLPEDSITQDQLAGHIQLFLKNENTIEWIKEKTFVVSIENAVQDQEYLYTIHWAWPQVLGEIILSSDSDAYLNGRKLIYSEYSNGQAIREEVIQDLKEHPEKYFYSSLTKQPLDLSYEELNQIDTIRGNTTSELLAAGNNTAIQAFIDLSSYFNQTDQYIGKNIDCLRIRLVAELVAAEG